MVHCTVELQWLELDLMAHSLGWLELSSWSLQIISCIIHPGWLELPLAKIRERSGSVVECVTEERRAAGSSLTDVTVLCP